MTTNDDLFRAFGVAEVRQLALEIYKEAANLGPDARYIRILAEKILKVLPEDNREN